MNDIFTAFDAGTIAGQTSDTPAATLVWNPHPAFHGVSLKHMITAKDTDGTFSAHLVRIEPDAEIGDHVHAANWELHEVVAGAGHCVSGERHIAYAPGVVAIIPKNVRHAVRADKEGLCLLAKFTPALL